MLAATLLSIHYVDNKLLTTVGGVSHRPPYNGVMNVYEFDLNTHQFGYLAKMGDTLSTYYSNSDIMPRATTYLKNKNIVVYGGGIDTIGVISYTAFWNNVSHEYVINTFRDTSLVSNHFTNGVEGKDKCIYILNSSQKKTNEIVRTEVYKFDSNAQLVWKKYYPYTTHIKPYCIENFKNGFIIGADYGNILFNDGTSRPLLLFIDTSGSVIKEQYLEYRVKGINGLVVDSTDYSIVYCSRYWDSVEVATGYPYYSAYISKVDSNGVKKWGKRMGLSEITFFSYPSTCFTQIKRLKEGTYLTVGSNSTSPIDTLTSLAGYLVKFADCNDSVKIIWERSYKGIQKDGTRNYLYDFVELPDKRIIACGESNSPADSFPQQGWILGLDSFGCLVPGCESWTAIKEGEAENLQFRLFPNPAADYIYMDMQGVKAEKNYWLWVYDMAGRVMLQTTLNAQVQYSMNTSGFKAGVYVFELKDERGQVVGKRKIIKE